VQAAPAKSPCTRKRPPAMCKAAHGPVWQGKVEIWCPKKSMCHSEEAKLREFKRELPQGSESRCISQPAIQWPTAEGEAGSCKVWVFNR
jgi:hypothetical protein